MVLFIKQFQRETLTYLRQIRLLLNACLLFLMFIVFFPLTLPPDIVIMRTVLPAVIWMAMLLVLLLSAERMFQQDYEQGILEQWLVSPHPLPLLITVKVLVYWLLNLLPILCLCPIIALLFSLSVWETVIIGLSLLCSTPALVYVSALAAVFGVGANQKGALMALILLPLTLPVMIFGSGAITMAMHGLPVAGYLALLSAISILAACLLPFAIAAVMRISLVD
jgi:heme exporter protein B